MSLRGAYARRTTSSQKNRVLGLKREGLTAKIISERLGLSIWTVDNLLRKEKKK